MSSPHTVLLGRLTHSLTGRGNGRRRFTFLRLLRRHTVTVFKGVGGGNGAISDGVSFCSNFMCRVVNLPRRVFAPLFTVTHVIN